MCYLVRQLGNPTDLGLPGWSDQVLSADVIVADYGRNAAESTISASTAAAASTLIILCDHRHLKDTSFDAAATAAAASAAAASDPIFAG